MPLEHFAREMYGIPLGFDEALVKKRKTESREPSLIDSGYANFGHHIQRSSKAETCMREFWIVAPSNDKATQMRSVTMILTDLQSGDWAISVHYE